MWSCHERREAHSVRRVHVVVESQQRLDYVHVALTCGKMQSGAAVVVAGIDVDIDFDAVFDQILDLRSPPLLHPQFVKVASILQRCAMIEQSAQTQSAQTPRI